MNVNTLDEAERNAHEMLAFLRQDYERRAAPYIEIIVRIHSLRPQPVFVSLDTLMGAKSVPPQS